VPTILSSMFLALFIQELARSIIGCAAESAMPEE
jgi:hypothetical protein